MNRKIPAKKLLISIAVLVAVFVFASCSKKPQMEQEGRQSNNQKIRKSQQQELIWFEIPELNIKFQVENEIAEKLGYRNHFVEDGDFGYELYAYNFTKNSGRNENINYSIAPTFAFIGEYVSYRDDPYMKWAVGCNGDECCPADPGMRHLLIKTEDRIVCYFEVSKNQGQELDNITEKLFSGYLKDVSVKEINPR